jgi:hypothetical protein
LTRDRPPVSIAAVALQGRMRAVRSRVGAAVTAALAIAAAMTAVPAVATPPTASIVVSPSPPVVGQPVTFTARAQDSDGTVASYAWELDDDGDFADGSDPTATRTFDGGGTYPVYLRVVDNSGEAFVVYTDVVVEEASPTPEPTPAPTPPTTTPSGPPPPLLDPFPVIRVAGTVTGTGAQFTLVSVRAPRGARIVAFCRGRGCRLRRVARTSTGTRRMTRLEGRYREGARLVFRVTSAGRIGKYTRVVVRRGVAPARVDRCLWPGQARPRACP